MNQSLFDAVTENVEIILKKINYFKTIIKAQDQSSNDVKEQFNTILFDIQTIQTTINDQIKEILKDTKKDTSERNWLFDKLIGIYTEQKNSWEDILSFININDKEDVYKDMLISINIQINLIVGIQVYLANKKIDVSGIYIDWARFNENLEFLVKKTNDLFTILQNQKLNNVDKIAMFDKLNIQIDEKDEYIYTNSLDFLQPKKHDVSTIVFVTGMYKSIKDNIDERIIKLEKIMIFLKETTSFKIEEQKKLEISVEKKVKSLIDNGIAYEKAFESIKKEIKKKEDKEKEIEESKDNEAVVNKVISSFNRNQVARDDKMLIYKNGKPWKEGDEISLEESELKEPQIKETVLVNILYKIKEIVHVEYKRHVIFEATITYKKITKTFDIWLKNFRIQDDIDFEMTKKIINKVKDKYKTSHQNLFIFVWDANPNVSIPPEALGIEEITSLIEFSISYKITQVNLLKASLDVEVKVQINNNSRTKIIKIEGFKPINSLIDTTKYSLNELDEKQPFNLDFELSLANTWNDAIEKIKQKIIKHGLDEEFIKALKWISLSGKSLDSHILDEGIEIKNRKKTVEVFINKISLGAFTIYFKNFKVKQEISEDFESDNTLKVEIGATNDETIKTKDFVIYKELKKYGGWKYLTHAYHKINIENLSLSIDKQGGDVRETINKEIELDSENISIDKKINLWSGQYENAIAMQKATLDVSFHINDKGDLIARFTIWGKVKWQVRGETISIVVKKIKIE